MNKDEMFKQAREEQFQQQMDAHTMIGNLSHWRTNFKDNSAKIKILVGRVKILNLLDRFKV